MSKDEAQEFSEYEFENWLQFLRSDDFKKASLYKRNRARSRIQIELNFLKHNYPDSYAIQIDISDVDLTLE